MQGGVQLRLSSLTADLRVFPIECWDKILHQLLERFLDLILEGKKKECCQNSQKWESCLET